MVGGQLEREAIVVERSATRPSILLAESHLSTRSQVRRVVEMLGWRSEVVASSQELLQALSESHFDVVFADLDLAHQELPALVRSIRAVDPAQALFVATDDPASIDSSLTTGAQRVVARALPPSSLRELLLHAIGLYSSEAVDHSGRDATTFIFTSQELASGEFSLPLIDLLRQTQRLDHAQLLKLEMAFKEALTNSVEHGNLELESKWREQFDVSGVDRYSAMKSERLADPNYAERKVLIRTVLTDTQAMIVIRDEGPGFERVPNRAIPTSTNEPTCYGHGIAMIAHGVDQLRYTDGGRTIVLVKELPSHPPRSE